METPSAWYSSLQRPAHAREFLERGNVEPGGAEDAPGDIAHGHDFRAMLMRDGRREPADVSETLDGDCGVLEGCAAVFQEFLGDENDAATGGRLAPFAAVKVQWLAGDHGG